MVLQLTMAQDIVFLFLENFLISKYVELIVRLIESALKHSDLISGD